MSEHAALLLRALGDDAEVESTEMPSGAVDLFVRRGGSVASIQSDRRGATWGYSVDWDADEAMTGHDHEAGSLDAVAEHLDTLMR